MNKRQKIVLEAFLDNEEAVIHLLESTYTKAQNDIEKKAKALQKQIDQLEAMYDLLEDDEAKEKILSMQRSKVYQKKYQDSLKKQVSDILDTMHEEGFETVSEYLTQCYEEGFLGAMYDLHGQNIPLILPIDQEAIVRAVQLDSNISQGLYKRIGEDVAVLKKNIAAEISRGISTGASFSQIALQIKAKMTGIYDKKSGGALYRAETIAITEGHRIQIQSAMDANYKAKEKGADVVKQWDSTLDGNTRPSHRKVDGEIRELDEPFSNGLMFPGDPDGKASEVIRCRCALLQRARWALDEKELETLKERADYFGLDKTDNFEDFKKKYLKGASGEFVDPDVLEYKNSKKELAEIKVKLTELEAKADSLMDEVMDAMGTDKEEALNELFEKAYDEAEAYKEKVEALEKALKSKMQKAVEGLEKQINANFQFTQPAKLEGISFETAEKIEKAYQKIFDIFPEVKGKINGFELQKIDDMNDYAQTVLSTGKNSGRIYFNKMYFSNETGLKALTEKVKKDVKMKHHPIGCDTYEQIIIHELGHSIDTVLNSSVGNKVQQNRILRALGIDTKDKEAIKNGLSSYANVNGAEFMAEGFSEFILSEKPREIAEAVGKLYREQIAKLILKG